MEYYESVALPFGSVSAVMCFNRMATALCIIIAELFLVVNTNFFDDFCQIEIEDLCDTSWSTAKIVMMFHLFHQVLGWSSCLRSPTNRHAVVRLSRIVSPDLLFHLWFLLHFSISLRRLR